MRLALAIIAVGRVVRALGPLGRTGKEAGGQRGLVVMLGRIQGPVVMAAQAVRIRGRAHRDPGRDVVPCLATVPSVVPLTGDIRHRVPGWGNVQGAGPAVVGPRGESDEMAVGPHILGRGRGRVVLIGGGHGLERYGVVQLKGLLGEGGGAAGLEHRGHGRRGACCGGIRGGGGRP